MQLAKYVQRVFKEKEKSMNHLSYLESRDRIKGVLKKYEAAVAAANISTKERGSKLILNFILC